MSTGTKQRRTFMDFWTLSVL